MSGYGVVLFAAVFQFTAAQWPKNANVPEQCNDPPANFKSMEDCCKIPLLFPMEDEIECNRNIPDKEPPNLFNPKADCTREHCLLKKYNSLKDDKIDNEAFRVFLNEWGEANSALKPAIESAIEQCLGKKLLGPRQICDFNHLLHCIRFTIFTECPDLKQTDVCQTLKKHTDVCKTFHPIHLL